MKAFSRLILILFILALGIFAFSEIKKVVHPLPSPPTITSSADAIEIPCDYTDEQILQGLQARGAKDGDLTDQLMVGNLSRFREKGVSTVTYVVFDSDNQPATYTRQVTFTDYRSPEFTLQIPLVFSHTGTNGVEAYVGATDLFSGDISNTVRYEDNDINFSTVGTYSLTVEASNSFGDTSSLQLPVHIVEEADLALQINLTQGLVYIDKGEAFAPASFIESVVTPDGSELSNNTVACYSGVDTQNAGVYEVRYVASVNGVRGVTWLTVVVRE